MKRICAWCGKDLGKTDSSFEEQGIISHGICDQCAYQLFAETGQPLQLFLDGLEAPVIVIGGNRKAKTANEQACGLLQKDLSCIEGYRGGEVFGCAFASLPEGCGNTVHCGGCTIGNAVMDTFTTGRSSFRIPVFLNHKSANGVEKVPFFVSTEKVGSFVLLRIDEWPKTPFGEKTQQPAQEYVRSNETSPKR